MNEVWVHLFLNLLNNAPILIPDVQAVFKSIATGEGGLVKIESAAANLLRLANDAAIAAAAAKLPPSADLSASPKQT